MFLILYRVEPETIALSDIVEIRLTWTDRFWDCFENLIFKLNCSRKPVRSMGIFKNSQSVFRRVDGASKVLFPLSFVLFNFFYWTLYVYILWNGVWFTLLTLCLVEYAQLWLSSLYTMCTLYTVSILCILCTAYTDSIFNCVYCVYDIYCVYIV